MHVQEPIKKFEKLWNEFEQTISESVGKYVISECDCTLVQSFRAFWDLNENINYRSLYDIIKA